ncbi:putative ribonuclease H-like domain-containing protein [Tanacetum coccineum]|uniref:Ribonuclease H-like domain-containing protein n=1 Tax=Tanacetum coccineum TaxID=301880 RepID=A0ABQ5IKS1_9ASTR
MDLETTQNNVVAKLPLLKQGDYEMWKLRIEQYLQVQDYALWDVIENGNSFNPVARTTTNADGTSTSTIPGPVTTEEKTQKKNDVKARSMLLIALPNEHQWNFNQYKDAKTLSRFGGNDATKKTQKTLLKQISLSSEWNAHVVVWRNKPDVDTMSFDDLYNNFKIVEQKIKRNVTSSSNSGSQNMAFVSTPSSTNEVNTANVQVSTASSSVSTDSIQDSTTSLSDATVYAFLANQPNGSQLLYEDLEQIHEDDLEEMDLKWQLALLSMRERKYYQRTGKKITINGSDTTGYDKSKVECFDCHKMGYFARECRGPRNQENKSRNQDSSRRTVNVEDTSSKATMAINGAGFDYGRRGNDFKHGTYGFLRFRGLFSPPTIDLSYSGLEEFQQPEFQGYGPKASKSVGVDTSAEVKQTPETPLVEELVLEKEKQTFFPTKIKFVKQQDKTTRKPVKYAEMYRSQKPKGNQRNWNNLKSQQLGSDFLMTHPNAQRNMVPRAVLMKTGLKSFNTVRTINTAHPKSTVGNPQQQVYKEKGVFDSGCSRHMTGNKYYLTEYEDHDGGFVSFGDSKDRISGKGKATQSLIFTWVFFLASKDETSGILKNFITEIENLVDKKVKVIRCDNGTEFKNRVMNEFCEQKGVKREYSVTRTPQQNGVAKRRNRTLIEAARTMLADSNLPIIFWAEAVNTACYVQNRVIIVKPHNKTPYELFRGRTPALSFMRPFGCHVSILNTLDHLGKFDGKSDDGFFVGYSLTSKDFRVYNKRTRRVEENLHIRFLEDKPIVAGDGPKWLFNLDSLTKSMNYVPVIVGTNSNDFAGSEVSNGEGSTSKEASTSQEYTVMPMWKDSSLFDSPSINISHDEPESSSAAEKRDDEGISKATKVDNQERPKSSSQNINTAGPSINTANPNPRIDDNVSPEASNADLFSEETEIDMSNLNASYQRNAKTANGQGLLNAINDRKPHEDLNTCMFFCFLSQEEPKTVTKALSDSSWLEAMQEELLQFKLQNVWVLIDLPKGNRAIGTKWTFRNKKDERGIVIRNKARLVAHGYTHEEGIDYDEVFAPVARIEAIGLFLAYASFIGFIVYQMDIKSAFLYGSEGTVWVASSSKSLVYVDDIIFGYTKKELCLEFERLMHDKFQMSSIGELTFFLGLQVKQKADGIFISQDKYVTDILRKYGYQDVKTASTPMDTENPLLPDSDGDDIDVHLYRSMIGSLMYLISSRPDITFAVFTCARFQVTPKVDYAGASIDRKSTTGGCQFLGCRLISWQCKKQTVVATSSTEAEYVAAASSCGQVLWIQNQMLDYGYNFMQTMINIDNNNTICIVKTKHIEIRFHFIRDCNEKKLIQVVKIHTDQNLADLLTKALDVGRISTVGDEVVHKELGDSMERAAITASSLEVEQDSWVADAQTWFEAASKQSNDPPLSRVNTLGSGEDSIKLMELMAHCTKLSEFNLNQLSIHHMANLEFCDKHNMVAYLEKSEGNEGFHKIIDFLSASHIHYALTESPTLYASLIEQYWQTAALSTTEDGVNGITATLDGRVKTITEASLRRHLKLEDSEGITSLPTVEIFEQLALIGYEITSDSLTFLKGHFTPSGSFSFIPYSTA